MKNTLVLAAAMAVAGLATTASAGGLSDPVVETPVVVAAEPANNAGFTLNAYAINPADGEVFYSLEATADAGFALTDRIDGLVGGELAFTDAGNSDEVALTQWYVGVQVDDNFYVTAGKQDDIFVGSMMRQLGGYTLAEPTSGEYSLITGYDTGVVALTGFIAYNDDANKVDDWTNAQLGAYIDTDVPLAQSINLVVDIQNNDGNDMTFGAEVLGAVGNVSTGLVGTYTEATEVFAYEAMVGYQIDAVAVAGFIGGDDTDAGQYVGLGVSTTVNDWELWAEGAYDLDNAQNELAVGVSFTF